MKAGDVVEVHFATMEDLVVRDIWVPALVIEVRSSMIVVKPMNRKTFPTGDEMRALPLPCQPHMWR
jgi:hypothetical protein